MEQLKTCPMCRQDKALGEFYVRHSRRACDGGVSYQHGCKACRLQLTRDWQAANPARTRAIGRLASLRYYRKNKAAIAAKRKAKKGVA